MKFRLNIAASVLALAVACMATTPGISKTSTSTTTPTPTSAPKAAQEAWSNPAANKASNQETPGYSQVVFTANRIIPIRLRETMNTTIRFPSGESIEDLYVSDPVAFEAVVPRPNIIMVRVIKPGADGNLIALGSSGRLYQFYVRGESVKATTITDILVDVVATGAAKPAKIDGMTVTDLNGMPPFKSQPQPTSIFDPQGQGKTAPANNPPLKPGQQAIAQPVKTSTAPAPVPAAAVVKPAVLPPVSAPKADQVNAVVTTKIEPVRVVVTPDLEVDTVWLKSIGYRQDAVVNDLVVYMPGGTTAGIAPDRVSRDARNTYINYGPKADGFKEWPTATVIVDGVEVPAKVATSGPKGRILVVEQVGDIVLRSQGHMVTIKRTPSTATAAAAPKTKPGS